MKIQISAVGTKMPAWVQESSAEYVKRLPRDWSLEWKEVPIFQRNKNTAIKIALEKEWKRLGEVIDPQHWLVMLDVGGKLLSTEQLAQHFARWQEQARVINLVIGGPDGLPDECRKRADFRWSLSPLTLPHPLVRVLLAEQIYRAWTILNHHPYHK